MLLTPKNQKVNILKGYKDYIHLHNDKFISDFLFDVAQDFKRQLRNMSITKLKYEVTKKIFREDKKIFLGISYATFGPC